MKPIQDPNYFRMLKELQRNVLKNIGTNFTGASPPEIFVGEYNYPNVFAGMLAPATELKEQITTPEAWYQNNFTINDILLQRGSMIYSRFVQPVSSQQGKLKNIMQEVSMAKRAPLINFELRKKPTINLTLDSVHKPIFNPAPLQHATLESNPTTAKRVEYIVGDHELKAADAIIDLHQHGFSITNIDRLLSAGLLGIKPQRKLVPTKWSITATDSTVSQHLIDELQYYPWIENIELYHGNYLGNHYEIILIPRQWSFEVIEAKYQPNYNHIQFWQDYESHYRRKTYASSVVGGYYAVRIGIAEQLARRKKQASALALRQVKDYDVPCGVGILRELTRDIMLNKPEEFRTLAEAFNTAQQRLLIPLSLYAEKSKLLQETSKQKSLQKYF